VLTVLTGAELGEARPGAPGLRTSRRLAPGEDWVLHIDFAELLDRLSGSGPASAGPVVPQVIPVLWRLDGGGEHRSVLVHVARGRPGEPATVVALA
jgi:hypothetical protein